MTDNPLKLKLEDTIITTWFERDRAHVSLNVRTDDGEAGDTIIEWWDGEVAEALEDGFLNPRDLQASAFSYASEMGLLNPANSSKQEPVPVGWVILHDELGVLMTWRNGEMIWSGSADHADLERGAVTFSDKSAACDFFESDDVVGDVTEGEDLFARLSFHEMVLDTTPSGHAIPRRVSVDALKAEGLDLHFTVPAINA